MTTIKSFTSLEQSKKLAKILSLESADMHYHYDIESDELETIPTITEEDDHFILFPNDVRCWSLAALIHLLPSKFTKKGNCSETTYNIDIRKYALTEDTNIYQIAYGNYKFYEDGNSSWKDIINTSEKENLIDVAFEMICWLKENNVL